MVLPAVQAMLPSTHPVRPVASVSDRRSPVLIMGCPRSGTTLLSQIVDSHSRIAVYHETQYYPLFRPDLHRYGDLRNSSNLKRLIADLQEAVRTQSIVPPAIEEFEQSLVAPTFEGVFTTFLHLYAQRQRKARGGDKTPRHFVYLSEILERLPDSPVIFIVRDPRDVVLSMRKRFGTSIAGTTRLWNEAVRNLSQASRPVHLIHYERLIDATAEAVEAICAFIGERYEPAMLRYHEREPETPRRKLAPVASGNVGNFREMSSRHIAQIEAVCGADMEALGYQLTTRAKVAMKATPRPLSAATILLDRLRYYGWNRTRWRRGWLRWRIVSRVRARYWLTPGTWRNRR